MKLLFAILIIIGSCCNAEQYNEWTKQLDTSSRTCHKTGKSQKCASSMGQTLQRCQCSCITDCNFNEIVNSQLSVCGAGGQGINKLESVDEEITEQIEYNVAGVLYGNMPVVGTLLDVGWAAWDPVSPITNPFALSNDIRKEINTVIEQLQQCMDDKISLNKVDQYQDEQNALIMEYQSATGATGDVQINTLFNTYWDFNQQLTIMFGRAENNYLEYAGMLPIYQSLYPLYVIVATERLTYLKYILKDESNFNNEFTTSMGILNILEDWIYLARYSAVNNLNDKVKKAECRNYNDMYTSVLEWEADFTETYIKNLAIDTAEIMKLQPKLCQIRFIKSGNFLVDDHGIVFTATPAEVKSYHSYWYQIQKPDDQMQLQNNATNRYLFYTEDKETGGVETSEIVTIENMWRLDIDRSWIISEDHMVVQTFCCVTSLFSVGRWEYIYEEPVHHVKFGGFNNNDLNFQENLEFVYV